MVLDREGAAHPDGDSLPETVLFDMDDTIFDHSLTCRASLVAIRRTWPFLRSVPLDTLWHEYLRLLEVAHVDVMLGRRSAEDARRERFVLLAELCGRKIAGTDAEVISRSYRREYQLRRRAVPGAIPFVRRLSRRATIAIVTNNTVSEQEEKLRFLGLDRTVDFLVTAEEVGAKKPDAEIFQAALSRTGVRATDAVMVGDSWESDVLGARAAGIRSVWFNRFAVHPDPPLEVPEFRSFRSPDRVEALLRSRASMREPGAAARSSR